MVRSGCTPMCVEMSMREISAVVVFGVVSTGEIGDGVFGAAAACGANSLEVIDSVGCSVRRSDVL